MDELRKKIKEYTPYFLDLFRRIYILTIFFIIFFIVGFFFSGTIIRHLTRIFDFTDVVLATTSPFQLVDLAMSIGMFVATALSIPLFLYHFYAFVGAGLRKKEKKIFFFLLPLVVLLFLVGFSYGFFILYFTMQALANVNISLGVKNLWDIGMFLSQIISTSALLGFIFEFPILMTFLVRIGFVTVDFMRKKRRYFYFGMCLFVSLLPPTDGISLILMTLPLILMYEVTIVYNSFGRKKDILLKINN